MRRRMILATAMVAALVVATLVAFTVVRANAGAGPASLTGHTWRLTRLVVHGQEQPLSATHPATLRFQSQSHDIGGKGGCNTFGASYAIVGDTLHISDTRVTLIACMDTRVMEQEASYLQALDHVETYHLTGNTLTLEGDGGQLLLTFSPDDNAGQ